MRTFSIRKDNRRISDISEIEAFERSSGIEIPLILKKFFLDYEGCSFRDHESFYQSNNGAISELGQVLYLLKSEKVGASVEAILEGHKEEGITGFIPFATDSGGWDFNVSINKNTYGEVWVNQFDSGDPDPMKFVAPSFEHFIENLGPDPDE